MSNRLVPFRIPRAIGIAFLMLPAACASSAAEELPNELFRLKAPVTALAVHPDGTVLAGSQAGLYGSPSESQLRHVHAIAVGPEGERIAVAGGTPAESGELEVFEWDSRKQTTGSRILQRTLHKDVIYSLAWSPDGKRLVTASHDHSCRVLDAASGEEIRILRGHSRGVTAVRFVDRQQLVTASLDGTIRVWDLKSGELIRTLSHHRGPVLDVAMRSVEEGSLPYMASVSRDRTVRLWQPTIGRMVRFVRLPSRPVSVGWLVDGSAIVAGCEDGCVRLIDPDSIAVVETRQVTKSWAWSLALFHDGRRLAVGGHEGDVRVIDVVGYADSPPTTESDK